MRELRREAGELDVTLGEPFEGLAPGQSAVFYRDGVVVGGGRIAPGTGSAVVADAACE